MTPTILQDCLTSDFKEQLQDILLKNAKGELVKLNVYLQNLPAKKEQKDSDHFPYVVIRVMDGETQENQDQGDESTCQICFIIGVYDDNDNYQGYKDVMNIIEKIKQRLFTKKYYNNQFELIKPFKWTIYDEDTYPYYFGGIETHWKMSEIFQSEQEMEI